GAGGWPGGRGGAARGGGAIRAPRGRGPRVRVSRSAGRPPGGGGGSRPAREDLALEPVLPVVEPAVVDPGRDADHQEAGVAAAEVPRQALRGALRRRPVELGDDDGVR